jgi:hypothetical protein
VVVVEVMRRVLKMDGVWRDSPRARVVTRCLTPASRAVSILRVCDVVSEPITNFGRFCRQIPSSLHTFAFRTINTAAAAMDPAILTPPTTPPLEAQILDDIFSTTSSPPHSRPTSPALGPTPDLQKLRQTHTTSGYRDGISLSKSSHIQSGFDEGYPLGGRIGLQVGWLLGVLGGLRNVFPHDQEVVKVAREAEAELKIEKVFDKQWWDGEGVWKWKVEGEEEEGGVTLDVVVDSFPVLRRWRERVLKLAGERGLQCRMLEGGEGKESVDEVADKMAGTAI